MTGTYAIGLSGWIIQDGNYSDFRQADPAAFAVEFFPLDDLAIRPPEQQPTKCSVRHLKGSHYRASGRVLHVAKDWWALDIGFGVFRDRPPPAGVYPGATVRGIVDLSLDHYSYFESLGHESDAPPLIYNWLIRKIEIQTASWLKAGGRGAERDACRLAWREIERTDARQDDGGHAEYLLHCTHMETPPTRSH